jgi:hypothetical protein
VTLIPFTQSLDPSYGMPSAANNAVWDSSGFEPCGISLTFGRNGLSNGFISTTASAGWTTKIAIARAKITGIWKGFGDDHL